jgi:hypothetical protein
MADSFTSDFGNIINREAKPTELIQPKDIGNAVVMACTPRASCITEIRVEPQRCVARISVSVAVAGVYGTACVRLRRDLFRQEIFTEADAVFKMLNKRFGMPLRPSELPSRGTTLLKVAIVTGAGKQALVVQSLGVRVSLFPRYACCAIGRGVGRVIATQLAAAGYRVAIASRTDTELVEVQKECRRVSPLPDHVDVCLRFPVDVTNPVAVAECVSASAWHNIGCDAS